MSNPIVEKRFEYKGYPCVVLFSPLCHRCGYVGIPKGTAIEVNAINCHGGITYTDKSLFGQNDKKTWWIGFDCGHYGDLCDFEAGKEYFKDDPEIFEILNFVESFRPNRPEFGFVKTVEYVENECKHIVDQIIEGENNGNF